MNKTQKEILNNIYIDFDLLLMLHLDSRVSSKLKNMQSQLKLIEENSENKQYINDLQKVGPKKEELNIDINEESEEKSIKEKVVVQNKTQKQIVYDQIKKLDKDIFNIDDVLDKFSNLDRSNLRYTIKRLCTENKIFRIHPGLYSKKKDVLIQKPRKKNKKRNRKPSTSLNMEDYILNYAKELNKGFKIEQLHEALPNYTKQSLRVTLGILVKEGLLKRISVGKYMYGIKYGNKNKNKSTKKEDIKNKMLKYLKSKPKELINIEFLYKVFDLDSIKGYSYIIELIKENEDMFRYRSSDGSRLVSFGEVLQLPIHIKRGNR